MSSLGAQELPDGWAWSTAGAACASVQSGSTPKAQLLFADEGEIPFLKVYNLTKHGELDFSVKPTFVTRETHGGSLRRSRVIPGDVLTNIVGPPLGKVSVVPETYDEWNMNQAIAAFRPTAVLSTGWLKALLMSTLIQQWLLSTAKTTTSQVNLAITTCRRLPLPIPPTAEQRRIVAIIDSYLSRLDDAQASLKRVQQNLKRYRASVLSAAVEGRLVPTEAELAREEGRDYEPASVLLKSILKQRRRRWEEAELAKLVARGKPPKNDKWKAKYKEPVEPDTGALPDLPEGWCWTRISTAGRVQLGRQRSPKHHQGPDMRPYLRVANVFEDRIDTSDVMSMNFTPKEFEAYQLHPGDILLNEGQSPHLIGRPAMYRGEFPGACFTNSLVRFQAVPAVNPRFALIVFLAQLHMRRYMKIAQITTNIAHLGAGRFGEIEFPLPPLKEQSRIADEVESLLSSAGAAMATVETNKTRIASLRMSILKWAFEGKLVDQDPTDEPAEALLERIRAEREKVSPKPKRRVRRKARKTE